MVKVITIREFIPLATAPHSHQLHYSATLQCLGSQIAFFRLERGRMNQQGYNTHQEEVAFTGA